MSRRKNNFTKAMSHLKSNRIDEKINQLEEQPTNNTYGLMTVGDPSHTVQPPDIEVTELDFNKGNDDDDGRDTSGIFNEEGEILTIEPNVGDTSYILGPMASMYYGWWSGGTSTIGYIRQSDRKMVNLGTVPGVFDSWDGTTGFNSYGQLTLEQAQWFKNTPKKNDYRAFYPGPPSNPPDAFGRYECDITSTPKEFEKTPPPYVTSPTQGPESASDQFSGQQDQAEKEKDKNKDKDKGEDQSEWDELMKQARKIDADSKVTVDMLNASMGTEIADAGLLTLPAGIALWKVASLVAASAWMTLPELRQAVSSWTGYYQSTSNTAAEDEWLDSGEMNDARERSRQQDQERAREARERVQDADEALDDAIASGDQGAIDRAQTEVDNAAKNQERVQAQVAANRRSRGRSNRPGERNRPGQKGTTGQMHGDLGMYNSYKPQGKVLTESRKRILREIKKPYKVPKTPTKFKGIKPRIRVTGKGLIEVPEIPKQFKPEPTIWRKHNYDKNVRASQEKKNEVLEYVGAAADHWEYLTETRRKEKNAKRDAFYATKKDRDFLYDYWYGGKKHKVTRKEDIDNDCLVYIEDEDGKKFSMLQSKLNEMLEKEQMKDAFDSYIPEEEQGEREKNFDKVTRLKSIVGKIKRGDIGPEYPNEPPPELVNGWHPKLGKKYKHDKLDPQSAEAMPDTGNPEIDANIKKATDSKSKARKLKTLLGKKA